MRLGVEDLLEVAVLLLERGDALLNRGVGLHLYEKATRADSLNQRRPWDGAFADCFLLYVYLLQSLRARCAMQRCISSCRPSCTGTGAIGL